MIRFQFGLIGQPHSTSRRFVAVIWTLVTTHFEGFATVLTRCVTEAVGPQ